MDVHTLRMSRTSSTAVVGLSLQVLGPLVLRRDGVDAPLGGPLPQSLIAVLASAQGRTVSTSRLVDEIWGDDPPGSAETTVASYVSRLRRAIDVAGTDVASSAIRRTRRLRGTSSHLISTSTGLVE